MDAQQQLPLDRIGDPGYWQTLAGKRPAGNRPTGGAAAGCDWPAADLDAAMCQDGYFATASVLDPALVKASRGIVEAVTDAGWPAAFAFLFDEFWGIARATPLDSLMTRLLGAGYQQLLDIWAWRIPVGDGQHGFRPHREVPGATLFDDGRPKSLSVWIPLSDATLENGCMYVVPMHLELINLSRAEFERQYHAQYHDALLHRARALPAEAGAILCWNQHILHWGSFSSRKARDHRLSMHVQFIRGDVDPEFHERAFYPGDTAPTLLDPASAAPGFEERLALIARSLTLYHHGADGLLEWANALLSRRSAVKLGPMAEPASATTFL